MYAFTSIIMVNYKETKLCCLCCIYISCVSLPGSFSTASCTNCKHQVSCEVIREDIFKQVSLQMHGWIKSVLVYVIKIK